MCREGGEQKSALVKRQIPFRTPIRQRGARIHYSYLTALVYVGIVVHPVEFEAKMVELAPPRAELLDPVKSIDLPGSGPLAWPTRARRATRAGPRASDSAPGLPASRATARARCGLPCPARAVAALA